MWQNPGTLKWTCENWRACMKRHAKMHEAMKRLRCDAQTAQTSVALDQRYDDE
jgi:hypothetical protein